MKSVNPYNPVLILSKFTVYLYSVQRATRLRPGKCFAHSWAKVSWPVSGFVRLSGAWLLLRRWAHGVRSRYRPGSGSAGAKKRRDNPSALALVCLPAFNSVINIAVLDHRIGPVTGYNDVIDHQDADPVQKALKLKR